MKAYMLTGEMNTPSGRLAPTPQPSHCRQLLTQLSRRRTGMIPRHLGPYPIHHGIPRSSACHV